jgi:hypothetical protein
MPSKTEPQERLFKFLLERYGSQEPFSLDELRSASGFSLTSFQNYRSKQFGRLLVPSSGGKYKVSPAFRRFNSWAKFRDEVVSQKRKVKAEYRALAHERVMSFEFFMPLRNEAWLREALDILFFQDEVIRRLRAIQRAELEKAFPPNSAEGEADYLARVCGWISATFEGYSISHVIGRFKVGDLRTRTEVADSITAGFGRYLVDETTAIVRFLFPCGRVSDPEERAEHLANRIRWFFNKLFVDTILEVVDGEDEVWLLESGFRSQLQVFRAEK